MEENTPPINSLSLIPDDIALLYSTSEFKIIWKGGKEILKNFPGLNSKYEGFLQMFKQFTQLDIEEDIIENFTGEISTSITSTPEYLEELKKFTIVNKSQNDLAIIGQAVLEYQQENSGEIPDEAEELVPGYLTEVPQPPGDGSYIIVKEEKIENEKDREDKTVQEEEISTPPEKRYPSFYVAYSGKLNIAEIEEGYPRYYSETGLTLGEDEEGNMIAIPAPVPDIMMALGIEDKDPLTKLLNVASIFFPGEIKENTYRGLTYSELTYKENIASFKGCYTFIDDYFIMTWGRTKVPMEKTIDTYRTNQKSIRETRDYKIALTHIPGSDLRYFSCANLQKLLEIGENRDLEGEKSEEIETKIIEYSEKISYIWASAEVDGDNYHCTIFIPVNF